MSPNDRDQQDILMDKVYIEILGEPINSSEEFVKELDWNIDSRHSWMSVAKKLSESFELSGDIKGVGAFVIVEIKKSKKYYENLFRYNPRAKKILVIIELTSVNPEQFSRKMRNLFDVVLCPSKELCQKYKFVYYEFPNRIKPRSESSYKRTPTPNFDEIKFGIIATNKNSLHRDSLYYLRRRVVNSLSTKHMIYVAGRRWQNTFLQMLLSDTKNALSLLKKCVFPQFSKISCIYDIRKSIIVGPIEEKSLLFDKIDILLCLENNKYEISEKLFDALSNKVVSIYVGSKHILDYVDKQFFIYGGENWRQLRETIEDISFAKYKRIQQKLNEAPSLESIVMGLPLTPFDDIAEKVNGIIKSSIN